VELFTAKRRVQQEDGKVINTNSQFQKNMLHRICHAGKNRTVPKGISVENQNTPPLNTMNKHTTIAAFAAACLAGSTAYAGPSKPAKHVVEPVQESCITGDIGLNVTSNYLRKGIALENQGLILQPYADLHFRIYKGAGALTSVTADLGIWNSFQDRRTRVGGANLGVNRQTTSNWFEFDFQAGLTAHFNKLSLGGYFKTYESPSSAFQNTYTAGIAVSYDDSDMLGAFALHPHALVELQLEGTTGNNYRGPVVVGAHHGRGQYYEVGIAPGHSYGDLTLSLPVTAGFGSGGFYLGNRGFGFISVGVNAEYALNFVPACLGKWSINSGFTYYRLGGNNTAPNRSGASGAGFSQAVIDKNQLVFQGGLKVAF
jgi:hypothetical protein